MMYQCSKTGEFIRPEWGWTHCPFCGAELKPHKYMIPEYHEVWNMSPEFKRNMVGDDG